MRISKEDLDGINAIFPGRKSSGEVPVGGVLALLTGVFGMPTIIIRPVDDMPGLEDVAWEAFVPGATHGFTAATALEAATMLRDELRRRAKAIANLIGDSATHG